ncbi:MAG: hypothetical protein CL961_07375 [Euryarchaeota archaeon]|nr:hypothetical protein [Euryarchaeota archaeon]|tara:strand:- start:48 stop:287 length:240 start_codon:yes stop_codon:yes gene_type:complete
MLRTGVFVLLNEYRLKKMFSLEWLGQTIASLCWIVSVFVYGYAGSDELIMSTGDWLQLMAASCWFLSNISAVIFIDENN